MNFSAIKLLFGLSILPAIMWVSVLWFAYVDSNPVYVTPPIPKIETPAWKQADIPSINADLHGITRMHQERENGPVSILALNPGEYAITTHPRPREGWINWDDVR